VTVRLSALAHHQFRAAVRIVRETSTFRGCEFYACLVVNRHEPDLVLRLEFPRQSVSAGHCQAYADSLRQLRDNLTADEAIAGSIHFHPMSTHSSYGFLSYTDYQLLRQMALEQSADILVPANSSPPPLVLSPASKILANGQEVFRNDSETPVRLQILPFPKTQFIAHTFCLVNAGSGYYGRVLETHLCLWCTRRHQTLHPANVEVIRAPMPDHAALEKELAHRLEECIEVGYRRWTPVKTTVTPASKTQAHRTPWRRKTLLSRAVNLAKQLSEVLDELQEMNDE
jgi:hypothetical protein